MKKFLFITLLIYIFVSNTAAQPGANDPTFNTFGAGAFGDCTGASNEVLSCAIQPDGKIVIVGGFATYNGTPVNRVTRLNPDGSRDLSFDAGTGLDLLAWTTLVQPDGKILIGGNIDTYNGVAKKNIIRLNPDGTLETSFNASVGPSSDVHTMTLQPDNKIIVGGKFTSIDGVARSYIGRLNANGSLDASFNPGTGCNSFVWGTAVQPDGKIILGGLFTTYNGVSKNRIVRVNSNGSIDATFDIGTGFNGKVNSIVVQPDGKLVVGGDFTFYNGISCNKIARLNTDGSFDSSFNLGAGFGVGTWYVQSILLQPDNKIVASGWFSDYNGYMCKKVVRINTDGSHDTSFDLSNGFNNYVFDIAQQTDGKIITVGHFNGVGSYTGLINRVARLNTDGSVDFTFNPITGFSDDVTTTAIQADQKIIVGGNFQTYNSVSSNRIVRLNFDGSLDASFVVGTGFDNKVTTVALQADGKILVGGWFSSYNGVSVGKIARLNTDGSLDLTFNSGTGFDLNYVMDIEIQSDGKILAGGYFSSYDGVACGSLARINPNGSLDIAFNSGSGFGQIVFDVALQPDNKIIVGGGFTSYNGSPQAGFIRLNPDGTVDGTFNVGTGFDDQDIDAIVVLPDGKILVGGGFYNYNGNAAKFLARLNPDGSFDPSLNQGTGFNWYLNSISVQTDGKIIVAGNFANYNGVSKPRIARLNPDGTLDNSFTQSGSSTIINTLLKQPDGNVLVGGVFTSFNGDVRYKMTRIYGQCESDSTLDVSACSSFTANGQTYTTSGTYTQVIPNLYGCDSTITINLTLLNSDSTLNIIACGSHTENGQTYTSSGVYTQTIPNLVGCDSIITINLTLQNSFLTINPTACNNYSFNGQNYTASGTYTQVLTNVLGCDSIITINLTLNLVDVTISQSDITLTANETGATYQWLDCDNSYAAIIGENMFEFIADTTGNFAMEINLLGCVDTSACFIIDNQDLYNMPSYSTLMGEVFAFPVSTIDTCDAIAYAYAQGGVAPYYFDWVTQTNFDDADIIDSLCEGFQMLKIIDHIGDSAFVDFYVTDTANFFTWCDTLLSSYADTSYLTVSNCSLNYALPLDSAAITQFYFLMPDTIPPGDLYFIEITYYQSGSIYQHQDTLHVDAMGSYLIYFSVYCPNKSFNTIKTMLLDFNYPNILSINSNQLQTQIAVYPNPTKGIFTLNGLSLNSSIIIVNLLGEVVFFDTCTTSQKEINLSGMTDGIYLIKVADEKNIVTQKIIKY